MTQARIFVSHSSRDKAFADAFVQALSLAGVDVWYDEQNLGAGHLRRIIMRELASRPVFVVILSKAALTSRWVLDECDWAYDLQQDDPSRTLLPVVAEQIEHADFQQALFLRGFRRVEAGDLRPLSIPEAIAQTLHLLQLPQPQPSTATTHETSSKLAATPDTDEVDTVVVPAWEDAFRERFLGENRWYQVRISPWMQPTIKYIAVYQVAPRSAITHIAPVQSIEPWQDTDRVVLNFAEPAKAIGPIPLVPGGRIKAPQNLRYAAYNRIMAAKTLDDIW